MCVDLMVPHSLTFWYQQESYESAARGRNECRRGGEGEGERRGDETRRGDRKTQNMRGEKDGGEERKERKEIKGEKRGA